MYGVRDEFTVVVQKHRKKSLIGLEDNIPIVFRQVYI